MRLERVCAGSLTKPVESNNSEYYSGFDLGMLAFTSVLHRGYRAISYVFDSLGWSLKIDK